ncbi:MAG: RNA polymerase sigma factor [Lawsonibacter sp.]|nr:RNA polymerase sigma factor [Lawsonibacter sp.]
MEYSDFDLINGIKNGDKDVLSLLIRRWYPKIYSYCFKMTENEQDAYDITQDVFISVMQNIERFHIWNKFSSWIFTIAHNKCMDYFRLRKKTHSEQVLEAELHVSPPALEDQIAVSDTVEKALARLPGAQRNAIILHYFQQFTYKEIAHMTNTPLPTVKSRLAAAKKTLYKLLWEDFQ